MFKDFNKPNVAAWGIPPAARGLSSRWETKTGKANFIAPNTLVAGVKTDTDRSDIFQLATFRSQGQFNTTIYSDRDRFRGRTARHGAVYEPERHCSSRIPRRRSVSLKTAIGDDAVRRVDGFIVHTYNIPAGSLGGYYPECNPLIPLAPRHG